MAAKRMKLKRKQVDVSKETSWDSSTTASEEERIADIGEELERYLGPEYISYRKGDGNSQYAYLEGHEAI
jgi:recombination DNA repair RAD52 pathway protein